MQGKTIPSPAAAPPPRKELPSLLTTREVWRLLRVSKPTVYAMIQDGTLRSIRVRSQVRIFREDVEKVLGRTIYPADLLTDK